MAIDYGERRIGLAISDPLGITAQGLETLKVASPKQALEPLGALIAEQRVETIVVGLPRNMNGTEGKKAAQVRKWATTLQEHTGQRVVFWDERLTTVVAHQTLHALGLKIGRKTKAKVDRAAATMILGEYLDSIAREGPEHAPKGH